MQTKKLKTVCWLVTVISIFTIIRTLFTGIPLTGSTKWWVMPIVITSIFITFILWLYYFKKSN